MYHAYISEFACFYSVLPYYLIISICIRIIIHALIQKHKHICILLAKISILTCFPLLLVKSVCPIDIDTYLYTDYVLLVHAAP